jgi:hypothetical protein
MATDFKRILVRRGTGALPSDLQTGEFALKTDTDTLFIKGNTDVIQIVKYPELLAEINNFDAHAEDTENPHQVTLAQLGAEPANENIQTHIAATDNPHGITAEQLSVYTKAESDAQRAPVYIALMGTSALRSIDVPLDDFDELEITFAYQSSSSVMITDTKRISKTIATLVQVNLFSLSLKPNLVQTITTEISFNYVNDDKLTITANPISAQVLVNDLGLPEGSLATVLVWGIKY